jgi:hypothetical protein
MFGPRYLRFGTCGLIVGVLLAGAALGWAARTARNQRQAVLAITRAGGTAFYHGVLTKGNQPAYWNAECANLISCDGAVELFSGEVFVQCELSTAHRSGADVGLRPVA